MGGQQHVLDGRRTIDHPIAGRLLQREIAADHDPQRRLPSHLGVRVDLGHVGQHPPVVDHHELPRLAVAGARGAASPLPAAFAPIPPARADPRYLRTLRRVRMASNVSMIFLPIQPESNGASRRDSTNWAMQAGLGKRPAIHCTATSAVPSVRGERSPITSSTASRRPPTESPRAIRANAPIRRETRLASSRRTDRRNADNGRCRRADYREIPGSGQGCRTRSQADTSSSSSRR